MKIYNNKRQALNNTNERKALFIFSCWLTLESNLIWGFIGPALLVILVSIDIRERSILFPTEEYNEILICKY